MHPQRKDWTSKWLCLDHIDLLSPLKIYMTSIFVPMTQHLIMIKLMRPLKPCTCSRSFNKKVSNAVYARWLQIVHWLIRESLSLTMSQWAVANSPTIVFPSWFAPTTLTLVLSCQNWIWGVDEGHESLLEVVDRPHLGGLHDQRAFARARAAGYWTGKGVPITGPTSLNNGYSVTEHVQCLFILFSTWRKANNEPTPMSFMYHYGPFFWKMKTIIWGYQSTSSEVADEEAVGFRCFNILLALGLRGLAIPDVSHQQWGDYGRAIYSAGLKGATLKLTLICANGSGPYTSGRNHFTNGRAAELLIEGKDAEWFSQFTTDYCFDQRVPEGETLLTADDWMQSPGITGRLKQATEVKSK